MGNQRIPVSIPSVLMHTITNFQQPRCTSISEARFPRLAYNLSSNLDMLGADPGWTRCLCTLKKGSEIKQPPSRVEELCSCISKLKPIGKIIVQMTSLHNLGNFES
jgi:hypothetical protein